MPRSPERQPQPNGGEASAPENQVEAQIQAIINLSAGFQDNAGEMLADVWQSEAFRSLSLKEQEVLKAKYGGGETKTEKETETRESPVVTPESAEATTEKRQKTWLFIDYVIQQDPETGAFLIFENQSKFDDRRNRYVKNRRPNRTAIRIPDELAGRLQQEPALAGQVIEFCSDIRKHLDRKPSEGGLAMYYDVKKGRGPKSWQPKWKFDWQDETDPTGQKSRVREDKIEMGQKPWDPRSGVEDPMVIPPDIYAIVEEYKGQGSEEYHRDPRYRPWRGKALQRKREDLISEGLSKKEFEVQATPVVAVDIAPAAEVPAETAPSPAAAEAVPVSEAMPPAAEAPEAVGSAPDMPAETEKESAKEEKMRRCLADSEIVVRELVPALAALYPGQSSESRLKMIRHVVKTTVGILNDTYGDAKDAAALEQLGNGAFLEALATKVAKEADRLQTAKKFLEEHGFFKEKGTEVLSENSLVMELEKLNPKDPENALEQAAWSLVLDSLYDDPDKMRAVSKGTAPGEAEARVVEIVLETLRRLKDKKADSVDFDGKTNRLAVTDLKAIRRVIRSRFDSMK